jgi:hypothetical protein
MTKKKKNPGHIVQWEGKAKPEFKCKTCGKTATGTKLPYQWASIHQESAGVHDSACVMWKEDYFLCPDCRQPEQELVEALEEILEFCHPSELAAPEFLIKQIAKSAKFALSKYKGTV